MTRQYPELPTYPDATLRDIARNDSCPKDYRLQAVEVLVVRKSALAAHEDLADLVRELDEEFEGVVLEYPPAEPIQQNPALQASVTTATMQSNFLPPPKEPDDATG